MATRQRRAWAAALVVGAAALPGGAGAAEGSQVLFRVQDDRIVEASGIVADPSVPGLFMIQDAGTNSSSVFGLGPNGATVLTLNLPGIANEDWEDLDLGVDDEGAPALFIGDTGDAYFARRDAGSPARTEYAVVRVRKPELPVGSAPTEADAEDIRRYPFVFEDGASHNAEALLVQPGTNLIFVVDKTERADDRAYVWVGPQDPSTDAVNTFRPIGVVPVQGVSGGAFSSDGSRLVLRDAEAAYVWEVDDGDVVGTLAEEPRTVALPPQRQGEGIDFVSGDDAVVVNSEGPEQPVFQVPVPVPSDDVRAAAPASARLDDSRRPSGPVVAGVLLWLAAAGAGFVAWRRRHGAGTT